MDSKDSKALSNNHLTGDESGVHVALQKDIPHQKSSSVTTYNGSDNKDIREDLV